jgi:hypothetical protein
MKKYYSFLLRLWEIDNSQNQAWLASLEDPHTRQIVSFTSLERLFEFIKTQTNLQTDDSGTGTTLDMDRSGHS